MQKYLFFLIALLFLVSLGGVGFAVDQNDSNSTVTTDVNASAITDGNIQINDLNSEPLAPVADPLSAQIYLSTNMTVSRAYVYYVTICNVSATEVADARWVEKETSGDFTEPPFERSLSLAVNECKTIYSTLTPARTGQINIGFSLKAGSMDKEVSTVLNVSSAPTAVTNASTPITINPIGNATASTNPSQSNQPVTNHYVTLPPELHSVQPSSELGSRVSEKDTCIIYHADGSQTCTAKYYSTPTDETTAGSCSGVQTCSTTVSENMNRKLTWTASCGGQFESVVDGTDKYIALDCIYSYNPSLPSDNSVIVQRAFEYFFGREPTSAELASDVTLLDQGMSMNDFVYNYIYKTAEFEGKYHWSTKSNPEFVTAVYTIFQNRSPEPQGFQYWLGNLNNGTTRDEVVGGAIYGIEFDRTFRAYIASGTHPYNSAAIPDDCKGIVLTLNDCKISNGIAHISVSRGSNDTSALKGLNFIFDTNSVNGASGEFDHFPAIGASIVATVNIPLGYASRVSLSGIAGVQGTPKICPTSQAIACTADVNNTYTVVSPTVASGPVQMAVSTQNSVPTASATNVVTSSLAGLEGSPATNLVCSGCVSDNKCYPFGYRKGAMYCFDDYSFKYQLPSDANCNNSFECESNVCAASKCISQDLLTQVLNWFKTMFGVQ